MPDCLCLEILTRQKLLKCIACSVCFARLICILELDYIYAAGQLGSHRNLINKIIIIEINKKIIKEF